MEQSGVQGGTEEKEGTSVATSFTPYGFNPLMGRYPTTIEANGRVVLPAALRYPYAEQVVVMPAGDKFLMIQTPFVAHLTIEKIKRERKDEFVHPRLGKRSFAENKYAPLDKQFRFVIPPEYRQAVGITEQIVICGAGECVEIWSAERWESDEAPYAGDTALFFETFEGL